ncbi:MULTISPECIES: Mce protein [Mycobacterium]|uniref:Mce protein n=1 Tax=Mycobacterium TaxID=1763 RepID=UPI001CDA1DD2|nr:MULTISPECIES: Mce protein [Mycobacterium]MCA2244924.1 Mce protein [Mycobacterium sp. WUMAC-067]MCA2316671.1 Mce protein [Mycobacterium sp. WUMAC-025]MEE3754663.1 Mce protein [Mycobacterium intracellulare]
MTHDNDAATEVAERPGPTEAEERIAEPGHDPGESRPRGRFTRWRERVQQQRFSAVVTALVAGGLIVATLAGLSGWLGYRAYQQHDAQARRNLYVATARQGAVNLTTINYTQVDTDVQRILDSATGAFRDDFEQRSKPFMEVVKAAQSKSEGTVTDAGLESQSDDSAQVLVAVAVKSRTAGGEEAPREWRMRIEVRSVGPDASDAKVSNVVFVP